MKIEKIKIEIPTKEILLGDSKVNVKQYLDTQGKIKLLESIQTECLNTEMLNPAKLDALFNAFTILNYTDIEVEDRDLDGLIRLYDYFEINGYMTMIINAIPKVEYDALIGYLQDTINDYNKFKLSFMGTLESLMALVPELMERVAEISKEIDVESLGIVKTIYNNFGK